MKESQRYIQEPPYSKDTYKKLSEYKKSHLTVKDIHKSHLTVKDTYKKLSEYEKEPKIYTRATLQ